MEMGNESRWVLIGIGSVGGLNLQSDSAARICDEDCF